MAHKAVNWNIPTDSYSLDFHDQNFLQIWKDQDLVFGQDAGHWSDLTADEQDVFKKVLGGLTLLDTKQTAIGMPVVSIIIEDGQKQAVFNFMGMMEGIHAKTYSSIFTSIIPSEETDKVFAWVETQKHLQKKVEIIEQYYKNALMVYMDPNADVETKKIVYYMCLAASVLLESFLFYSGFFYPLYLAGTSRMLACGEGITLICRDEAIHGLYTGLVAQDIQATMTDDSVKVIMYNIDKLIDTLMDNEIEYTTEIYSKIGLVDEVVKFLKYNADRALMNLGLPAKYNIPSNDVNPIVFNGLRTATPSHDFFSRKGSGYFRATNIKPLTDEDLKFDIIDEFA